jgi:uncharacterized protein (TIGR00375 family)
MTFETLSIEAPKKGIQLVGSGDCLFPKWFEELSQTDKIDEGTFELNGTRFIPTAEVQAQGRVHHLFLFPSLSAVEQFKDGIKGKSKNLATDGRPHAHMTGAELGDLAIEVDALFGPCHAFTPWTGLYGHFESLKDCYQDQWKNVAFLELGLSADSDYADHLAELKDITFLSNSDAHSPYPLRLGREFNQFEVQDTTFSEVKKAILRRSGRKCTLNVGLPPEEGKYNQSACSKCYTKFSVEESVDMTWKCNCGGRIKKGVAHRVVELGDYPEPRPPRHRPKYLHVIPLAEIIQKALNFSNTQCVGVKKNWSALIAKFGSEITTLLEADIRKISEITNENIAQAIQCFREDKIILHPGGGGKYGEIELPKAN